MRILFVAADPMEFKGLLPRTANIRTEPAGARWTRSGRMGGHDVLFVANGMGWKRAAAAMEAARTFRPEAVVSTGFCGALDGELRIADVVAATAVTGNGLEYPSRSVDAPHLGKICSIDHVAQTAEEKRKLRESGACAVEMEAAAVAAETAKYRLPFYCVRAVTDLAGETMNNDFNRALREDGHLDTINILRGALCRPTQRVPELLRLRRRCVQAAEALGEFFVGCRF
jgi:adenosylhomocysteine nucleosidase